MRVCPGCGQLTERKTGYCPPCQSVYQRTHEQVKERLCSNCGGPTDKRSGYCGACHAEYMRNWRARQG